MPRSRVLHLGWEPYACMLLIKPPTNAMLSSAECRERAEQKITEAELQPRHEKRLRTAAQGWLVLADLTARLEASVSGPPSVDPAE